MSQALLEGKLHRYELNNLVWMRLEAQNQHTSMYPTSYAYFVIFPVCRRGSLPILVSRIGFSERWLLF